MNFAFSDEQEQLRDAVRKFLEAKSPESEVRRTLQRPFERTSDSKGQANYDASVVSAKKFCWRTSKRY